MKCYVIQLSLMREAAKWKIISTETRAYVEWPKLCWADVQIAPVHFQIPLLPNNVFVSSGMEIVTL